MRIFATLRELLARTGVLARLERHTDHRTVHWFVSLFAVYDVQALNRLDTPWWSYRAIDVVDGWLQQHPDARVFEYGTGASTLWLARRAARVESVDHDPVFSATVSDLVPDNVTLHVVEGRPAGPNPRAPSRKAGYSHLDFGEYVDLITRVHGPFDLIAIDGRSRVECLRLAQKHLAPGGIIVFDNAGRAEYQPTLRDLPFDVRFYRGMAPSLPHLLTTAVAFS